MRGAVITQYKKTLEVLNLPDPAPGPADAIIQTEACGICRSDWHLWQHDWTWLGIELTLPRVPGHEFGGTVVEVGREVKGFRVGDRVTVPFRCGHCEHCRSGRYNLCLAYGVTGPTRLVETAVSVTDAGKLLGEMTNYNTLGLTVINEWTARAA
jgi:D-arabinose 1-dehydrogenase-like Zn-dependent alcohol dehydrogenase